MKVLIACEFSGIVREEFRKRGHNAWSCDFLNTDIIGKHYKCDVLKILDKNWDLMIAHPPCKYICVGGNNWLNRRPDLKWKENRKIALEFVWKLRDADIDKIAIENPIGVMSSKWRKPDQIIRPWMFGHGYNKDVCLWLKNLPCLKPTKIIKPPYKKLDFWSNKRNPNGRSLKSITFKGIAKAMAEQWG